VKLCGWEVIVSLASQWPCVTHSVIYPPTGSMTYEREMSTPPTVQFRLRHVYLTFEALAHQIKLFGRAPDWYCVGVLHVTYYVLSNYWFFFLFSLHIAMTWMWLVCNRRGKTEIHPTVAEHWSAWRQSLVSELFVYRSTRTTDSVAEKQHTYSPISCLQGLCQFSAFYKTF